jgi:hypothetical protein
MNSYCYRTKLLVFSRQPSRNAKTGGAAPTGQHSPKTGERNRKSAHWKPKGQKFPYLCLTQWMTWFFSSGPLSRGGMGRGSGSPHDLYKIFTLFLSNLLIPLVFI